MVFIHAVSTFLRYVNTSLNDTVRRVCTETTIAYFSALSFQFPRVSEENNGNRHHNS
jgi:hypothetical protein